MVLSASGFSGEDSQNVQHVIHNLMSQLRLQCSITLEYGDK